MIEVAGYRGETLHIHERHRDESGHRIVRVGHQKIDDLWAGFVGTNDWSQTKMRADAEVEQDVALLYYEPSEPSSETLALLTLEAVSRWPGEPLDLVLAWMPAADGAQPRN